MAAFRYEALDAAGVARRGVMEADAARQVRQRLREQGLVPVEIEALAETATSRAAPIRRALSSAQLSLVTRQFATLVGAGLTVEQTLNALVEQVDTPQLRNVMAEVRSDVVSGQSLARALEKFPGVFPEIYRTLVAAGEQSGRLAEVLTRLADYTEARALLQQKVGLAFVYPAIVTAVAAAVVLGLLTYVVPQVVSVFENTHQALPWLTRALIATSAFLRNWGIVLLVALALAAWAARRLLKREAARRHLDVWVLGVPIAGPLVRGMNTARFASTLAILSGSGVPLLAALQAGVGVVTNLPMRDAVEAASRMVREGGSLARALERAKVFPPLLTHLIASGEATGRLPQLLERAAVQQTQELERRVSMLISLLEPLLILAMGAVVLVIVLSILLPIFQMNQLVR